MRTYVNIPNDNKHSIINSMLALIDSHTSVESYRDAFYQLGKALGLLLSHQMHDKLGNTMLACASEDADWLVHGILNSLTQKKVSLAVFWNERLSFDAEKKIEYSPIVKSYIEPIHNCETLILVKSIISTSCVVKTQLTRLVNEITPKYIFVVSPVMYKDAESNLKMEFPEDISNKFNFLTFAIDTERDEHGQVIPGIGGMVYPKLGLGDIHEKNRYIPHLVRERTK